MNRPGVGVGVFIFKDHKFLMIKRGGKHGHGTWTVPGGWIEGGETFEQTSKREIKEEVNLDISNLRFGALTNNIFKDENMHSLTVWMLSDYKGGELKIMEPDKIEELKWCDFDSLPAPLFQPWYELLKSEFLISIKKQLLS
jgi:8-oxo-dGTP diphosphatase